MAETIFHSLFVGSDRAGAGKRSASRTSHTGGAWVLPLQLFIIWTVVGLIFSFQMVVRGTSALALAFGIIGWWQWALITGLVARFDRALPFTDKQLGRRIAAHGAFGTIVNCTYVLVNGEIGCLLGVNSWNPLTSLMQALDWLLWCWPVYALIVGGVFAFRYYKRYQSSELQRERLERAFAEARLNALRMQLDPHFLFNALNTISSQVGRDPKLARTMIEHLGDLLRLSLETKDRNEVALFEELVFLEHYLEIQKMRFGDRLKIELRIAPDVKYTAVPSLFIQPLAENAIRHGLSGLAAGGTLIISAKAVGNQLEIKVLDDGVGLPLGWQMDASSGLGLSVTRERIVSLYPGAASRFVVKPRSGGGTEVNILLPYRKVGSPPNGPATSD